MNDLMESANGYFNYCRRVRSLSDKMPKSYRCNLL